jgi:hypothetical protein
MYVQTAARMFRFTALQVRTSVSYHLQPCKSALACRIYTFSAAERYDAFPAVSQLEVKGLLPVGIRTILCTAARL